MVQRLCAASPPCAAFWGPIGRLSNLLIVAGKELPLRTPRHNRRGQTCHSQLFVNEMDTLQQLACSERTIRLEDKAWRHRDACHPCLLHGRRTYVTPNDLPVMMSACEYSTIHHLTRCAARHRRKRKSGCRRRKRIAHGRCEWRPE